MSATFLPGIAEQQSCIDMQRQQQEEPKLLRVPSHITNEKGKFFYDSDGNEDALLKKFRNHSTENSDDNVLYTSEREFYEVLNGLTELPEPYLSRVFFSIY